MNCEICGAAGAVLIGNSELCARCSMAPEGASLRAPSEKHANALGKMLAYRVAAMSRAAQLRLAADYLDQGMPKHTLAILQFALAELEKEVPNG
jgi:hypothetical protein